MGTMGPYVGSEYAEETFRAEANGGHRIVGNSKLSISHTSGKGTGWLGCGTAAAIRRRASNGDDGRGGLVYYLI